MDVTGTQKIKAPRQQVFQALLNPNVLKESIPGCESAELVESPAGSQLKLAVAPNLPGMKGAYAIYVRTGEVVAPSRIVLITEPSSSIGSIKATCAIDLADHAEGTMLSYNAHAEIEGKIAATPEFVIKGAVKVALDQFFKHFEKQVLSMPV